MKLKAPFPYFGGKSKVAFQVWERLGDVRNYIEPFCGSAAVLLARPSESGVETVNDYDCFIANFWRAVRHDPEEVVEYADWPVNETDLHARHRWLVSRDEFRERMRTDPEYFDAKVAGWWVWGACCWIGSGWCSAQGVRNDGDVQERQMVNKVRGVCVKRPSIGDCTPGKGVHRQIPDLSGDSGAAGRGIHSLSKRIQLSGHGVGKGVHCNNSTTACLERRVWLMDWICRLSDRLRPVRVCCGDWQRVCNSDSVTTRIGLTGIFLDPPYPFKTKKGKRSSDIYASDVSSDKPPDKIRDEVLAYCRERGGNPQYRIAVCGYQGDGYEDLETMGWTVESWPPQGGYANRNDEGNLNKHRERIWYSPHCLSVTLFESA